VVKASFSGYAGTGAANSKSSIAENTGVKLIKITEHMME
jgi:hypothetical protein